MTEPTSIIDWVPAPLPNNERERLDALRSYDILDSVEEEMYDAITRAAAEACGTSLASITFIDSGRQWFKSRIGLKPRETERAPAFCAHAINGTDLFLVEDTKRDPRFIANPFVVGSPHLRFYAGMPLVAPGDQSIGTLCVLDTKPRTLTPEQAKQLRKLATATMRLMEIRRKKGVAVFAKVIDLAADGIAISGRNDHGDMAILYANESFLKLVGASYMEVLDQPPLERVCAENLEVQRQVSSNTNPSGGECLIRTPDGRSKWVRYHSLPYLNNRGELSYLVTALKDITAFKEVEIQSQQLYAMKTTLASIQHFVNNFLNSAQLYSSCVSAGLPVTTEMQSSFDAALRETKFQMATLQQMNVFRDRQTPFGFAMLDTEAVKSN